MSTSKTNLLEALARAAEETMRRQTDTWRRAASSWQSSWQSASPDAWKNLSLSDLGAHATSFARELWALNQKYVQDLTALSSDYARQVWEDLQKDDAPAPPIPRRDIPILFEAPVGQTATRTVVLENHRDGARTLGFDVGLARDTEGGEPFVLPLVIQPSECVLDPGEERAVSLQLTLRTDLFRAGRRYTADVRVVGYPGLHLALDIRPTAADEAPPQKPRRPTKTTKSTGSAARKKT